jgi:(E)-4-hydroxy-3-methylbut-2-enyl-diphosphate synthase
MKKVVFVGNVGIGGTHPVSIQSMTNVPVEKVEQTLRQIIALRDEGCQIVRVAVPSRSALPFFSRIVRSSVLPVVGDIHFDPYLALKAMECGAGGIRINPGNIGSLSGLKEILRMAARRKVPIRIGVNSGSIEKKYLRLPDLSRAERMVRSVMDKVRFFEDNGFFDMKISLKSSSVRETVEAYRLIDRACDYPLHLGITEAGTLRGGTVKSSVGIGALLLDGIGNTLRVSLTADPVEEVRVAREILKALDLATGAVDIISCPTCSRTTVDLIARVNDFEAKIRSFRPGRNIRVAIMGCEVNGPGEARDADVGVAFSRKIGYIFSAGKMIEKLPMPEALDRLYELVIECAAPKAKGETDS